MPRILFVASNHHPEQHLREIAATPDGAEPPLFPTSMGQHFWEKAMRKRGYELDVFWRNLSGFGSGDISSLRSEVHSEGISLHKINQAIAQRLPPRANPDYRRRNQNLIHKAEQFKPDIVWMIGDNRVITADTLATIKEKHACLIFYVSGTSPIVFSHPIERQAARLYDLVLVNDYYHGIQWLELGAKQMECLPIAAIDPEFHCKIEPQSLLCDVGFVGTLVPNNLYRERVNALQAMDGFDLGIWSVHEIPPALRAFHKGSALGKEMLQVLADVKVSVNVHGDFMRYGGNMRLFETAAINTFQIVDDRPGVHQWFTVGEHLVTFTSKGDLRDKVEYYLQNESERVRMAESARKYVIAHHTYDHRLDRVEELLQST